MDLIQKATEAAAAKRLARLADLSMKSLKPLPTWDAGYDLSGRRLVQTLGQDPVAVGRPISTGAVGVGDRTYNTGNAIDVIPHIKPVAPIVPKKEESGNVKILFSVVDGSERVYYVGGDRRTPKELFRYSSFGANPHLVNRGSTFYWQYRDFFETSSIIDSRFPNPIPFPTRSGGEIAGIVPWLGDGIYHSVKVITIGDVNSSVSTANRSIYQNGIIVTDTAPWGATENGTNYYNYNHRFYVGSSTLEINTRQENDGVYTTIDQASPYATSSQFALIFRLRLGQPNNSEAPGERYFEQFFESIETAGVRRRLSAAAVTILNKPDRAFLSDFVSFARGSAWLYDGEIFQATQYLQSGEDKLPLTSIDLTTSEIGQKIVKIFPIPINSTIQVHAITYAP